MFYHFDVDRWIIHQLPPILRRTAIYAFLRVFMYPLKQLAETFYAYKLMVDRQLSFNGFADMMQRFLNDLFFYPDGTIYITDIVEPVLSLSFIGEGYEPVYMSFDDELADGRHGRSVRRPCAGVDERGRHRDRPPVGGLLQVCWNIVYYRDL